MWAPAVLGLAFVILPILGVLARVPWGRLVELLTAPASLDALGLSLRTALASTALVVVLGVPMALAVVALPGRMGAALRTLVLVPLVLPPVVSGLALLAAFGRRGLLGQALGGQIAYTTLAVVLAQAFVSLPYLVLAVDGALRSRDQRLEDAAAALGASPTTVLRRVTLPLIGPSLATGTVLAFARALGEFGATLTFAGSLQGVTRTLPLEIYLQRELDPDAALALSVLLIVIAVLVVAGVHGRRPGSSVRWPSHRRPSPGVPAYPDPAGEPSAAAGQGGEDEHPVLDAAPGAPLRVRSPLGAGPDAPLIDRPSVGPDPVPVAVRAAVPARGVDLDVALPGGAVTAVLGPNGAGKSTLLGLVSGLVRARGGQVAIGGAEVTGTPVHRRRVALLAQGGLLFPHLTVLDNVAFGPRARGMRRRAARDRARAELDALGIGYLADRSAAALSGGQAQRVALARALAADPAVVLLDEPFAALDIASAAQMRALLSDLHQHRPCTTVLVTHDAEDVRALADHVVVIEGGRVAEAGPATEVLAAPHSPFARLLLG